MRGGETGVRGGKNHAKMENGVNQAYCRRFKMWSNRDNSDVAAPVPGRTPTFDDTLPQSGEGAVGQVARQDGLVARSTRNSSGVWLGFSRLYSALFAFIRLFMGRGAWALRSKTIKCVHEGEHIT